MGDETFDLLLGRLEAEGAQCHSQVLESDVAVGVGVEKIESLLDVLLLLLGELLAELAACLLAVWGGSRHGDVLGRQGHNLRLVVSVSVLRLKITSNITELASVEK